MGRIAFLFAGQGAQHPGMGQALYQDYAAAKAVFDRVEAVRPGTLAQCFESDSETLMRTEVTQPCLFTVDLACAAALEAEGVQAEAVAGFSLGEWAAVTFAGALTLEQAVPLVVTRANTMQRCADDHPGAMLAVLKLDAATVEGLCAGMEDVYPVNYNCPGQTVVACAQAQRSAVAAAVKAAGGRCVPLKVGGSFHTPVMAPASDALRDALAPMTLAPVRMPVYGNRMAQPYTQDNIKEQLALQASSPVRWHETLLALSQEGFDTFVECGPGTTLSGLVRRTLPEATALHVEDAQSLAETLEALKGGCEHES